jgi:hypothetical protein
MNSEGPWANIEVREYTFLNDDDADAVMIPFVATSVGSKGGNKPRDPRLWPRRRTGRTEIIR